MAEDLVLLLNELKAIREYLVKIGPSRRVGKILITKREIAQSLLARYNKYLELHVSESKLAKSSTQETPLINKICEQFNSLYTEVLLLCSDKVKEGDSSHSKMAVAPVAEETFNLKIALSLLPTMTDNDDNTKQLIESIEYYESILSKDECKQKLIQFILKNRLSQQAKLKLLQKYASVKELVGDMRKLLLPQKSSTALQTRLQQCRQNNRKISEFGKEISEIFVELTISQACGNSDNYDVLRPINEKTAIKRFADGLRDRRLSTIVAARNFSSLTEAIQAAVDEEISSSGSEEFVGMYQQSYYPSRRGRRGYRSQQNFGSRGLMQNAYAHQQAQGPTPPNANQQRDQQLQVPSSYNNYRDNYYNNRYRARGRQNRGRGFRTQNNINAMSINQEVPNANQVENNCDVVTDEPNGESLSHLFRA